MKRITTLIAVLLCLAVPASSLATTPPPHQTAAQKKLIAALKHKKKLPVPKKTPVNLVIKRWDTTTAEYPFVKTCVDGGKPFNNCLCLLAAAEVKSPDIVALNDWRLQHPVAFQQWHIVVTFRCASVK